MGLLRSNFKDSLDLVIFMILIDRFRTSIIRIKNSIRLLQFWRNIQMVFSKIQGDLKSLRGWLEDKISKDRFEKNYKIHTKAGTFFTKILILLIRKILQWKWIKLRLVITECLKIWKDPLITISISRLIRKNWLLI